MNENAKRETQVQRALSELEMAIDGLEKSIHGVRERLVTVTREVRPVPKDQETKDSEQWVPLADEIRADSDKIRGLTGLLLDFIERIEL